MGRLYDGFVPGRHAIDAYGNGGFRFAEMSHRGSILALPSGVVAWAVASPAQFSEEAFAAVFAEAAEIELLLIGAGPDPVALAPALRARFREAGLRVDVMQTGAAARTFNVLLAENRRVAAALVAV
ncbi:MAG TPA: MTH938/NDUFAF3 family protein [Beijerinckiaceae bacterium]|nr:MTH938/NDUFAF3 family protein [Beijerinckiaceae bacterium]